MVAEQLVAEQRVDEGSSTGIRRADRASVLVLVVAGLLWFVGLRGATQADLAPLGFVSLLDPGMVAALALLTVGFVHALWRGAASWLLATHLVVLVLLIHGTPAVFYETLRYSWAWKHVGIVDFIQRTGSVDPSIDLQPIYHGWPGFFAAAAALTELAGAGDAITIATWAPLAFTLANLVALRFLLRCMTGDRRMLWLALWLFTTANWVGQDYFSPQAMGLVLYLITLGIVLRAFRRAPARAGPLTDVIPTRVALPAFVLLSLAIVSSHQVTPFMLVSALAILVVLRVVRGWWLPVSAAGLLVGWTVTVGGPIVHVELSSLLEDVFKPIANAEETFEKASTVRPEQVLIIWAGRGMILLMAVLALVGAVRLWRRGRLDLSPVILAAVPVLLPVATPFGGEAVFRVYLFMLPGLSLLAAGALAPTPRASEVVRSDADLRVAASPGVTAEPDGQRRSQLVNMVATAGIALVLLSSFMLAHFGKDRVYTFTDDEAAASLWVAENSPPGSLLVEGSRNYPGWFRNYDSFTYVALSREPDETQDEILADPSGKLGGWLADDRFGRALVLLTRSQSLDVDTFGGMPPGSLQAIEADLRASPDFRVVFQNVDAVVFERADAPRGTP